MLVVQSLIVTFLALIFFISGISKMFNLNSFKGTLDQLRIKQNWSKIALIGVPLGEIATSILLVIPVTQFLGQVIILILLTMFVWAAWRARGRSVDCNCFGGMIGEQFGRGTYFRIFFIFALDLLQIMLLSSPIKVYQLSFIEIVSAILTSIGIILIYSLFITIGKYHSLFKE